MNGRYPVEVHGVPDGRVRVLMVEGGSVWDRHSRIVIGSRWGALHLGRLGNSDRFAVESVEEWREEEERCRTRSR